ncbi:MAG: minichromosome maintenance protein MCM [Candidatus Hodarchaeales archaeon]
MEQHLIDRFIRFYQEVTNERGELVYSNEIDQMIEEGARSLYVDLILLENFDPVIIEELIKSPKTSIESAIDALKHVILIKEADFLDELENRIYVRFVNPPDRCKHPLRKIRASTLRTLIATEAIITKATEVKPFLITAMFRCVRCQALQPSETFTEGEYQPPVRCINATNQDNTCTSKTFNLIREHSTFIDFQRITLQEKPEELPAGQMPESLTIFLLDDLCDIVRPGDRVKVMGILQTRTDGQLARGKIPVFSKHLEGISIQRETEEYTELEISDEDEQEIINLSQDPNIHRKIRNSIAPSIYGYSDEKEAISYLLFGGTTKDTSDDTIIRGESNILLIGDPGIGKSQILKTVSKLVPRGLYASGRGSSAAGLTASVIRDPDTNEMTLEAGVVVLADRGVAFIDEFDKMRREDRSALHEMMEQHSVSIAKAGIVATLNARTSILAAANPKLGRWDSEKEAVDNLNLPPTILSRFDLIFPLVDRPNRSEDEQKANHILSIHQNQEYSIPEEKLSKNFLRKYIAYARKNVYPKLSNEAKDEILQFYLDLREGKGLTSFGEASTVELTDQNLNGSGKGITQGDKSIAITPRQLESLIRLSEARAKIALRSDVSQEDAIRVIELFRKALYRVTKGDIDSLYGMSAQKRNKREIILNVLTRLSTEEYAPERDDIIVQAKAEGLTETDVNNLLDRLLQDGELFEPRPGQLRRMSGN